jgi:hypothetical protein
MTVWQRGEPAVVLGPAREDHDMESSYQPIEHYGVIGNLRRKAFVQADGSRELTLNCHETYNSIA